MKKILIVEDEPKLAADLTRALQASGYVAEVAEEGEDAWFRGDTEDFSAVILDLGLPRLDGLTVLKRWRAAGVETPVLILTARDAVEDRVQGLDLGADDYLPKPFAMEELLARVRALLRRAYTHIMSGLTAIVIQLCLSRQFCNESAWNLLFEPVHKPYDCHTIIC